MQASHLTELAELEGHYWWHVAKRTLVTNLLNKYSPPPGQLVEGGIGACGNLIHFHEIGYEVAGLDVMPDAISRGRERGLASVQVHDIEQPWPFPSDSVDAITLLDVLEHTAEPVAVLSNIRDTLKHDGAAVLTVPAYPWLFSEWDQALGHYRRYTTAMLKEQILDAGLKPVWLRYWNSFTLPAACAIRVAQKMRRPADENAAEFPRVSRWVNSLLLGCARIERAVMPIAGPPAGLSIACVIKKA